jgi:hypothetical protein
METGRIHQAATFVSATSAVMPIATITPAATRQSSKSSMSLALVTDATRPAG